LKRRIAMTTTTRDALLGVEISPLRDAFFAALRGAEVKILAPDFGEFEELWAQLLKLVGQLLDGEDWRDEATGDGPGWHVTLWRVLSRKGERVGLFGRVREEFSRAVFFNFTGGGEIEVVQHF